MWTCVLGQVVGKRVGWLMLLFVAASLTGAVLQYFEDELQLVIALGFFIPLVTGTGGNAGSQTVATIIRAITLGEVRMSTLWRAWRQEVATGLFLGLFMGAMGMVLGTMWGGRLANQPHRCTNPTNCRDVCHHDRHPSPNHCGPLQHRPHRH